MAWKLQDIYKHCQTGGQRETPEGWVPARPLPFYGLGALWQRCKDAASVLRGRAEAFEWPGGQ